MEKIGIGILGSANIALRSIVPNLLSLSKEYHLVGLASRSDDKAREVSQEVGITTFSGYDELLSQPELKAVYIPLPNSLHHYWVKECLNRGIHVLCEKSLGCNLAEVEEMNKLAQEQNVVLIENFQFRFHNQLRYILNSVEKGKIGQLRSIRSSFGFPPFNDKDNIRYQKDLGGGALLDAGAYPVKLAQIFMGHDLTVRGASLSIDEGFGVDTWGGAFLKQREGSLFAEIAFGFDHFYQCNLELWGSKGRIFTNRIFTAPPGYEPVIQMSTMEGIKEVTLPADNHFKNMLIHFHSMITNGGDLNKEYSQNINQARLLAELKTKANV